MRKLIICISLNLFAISQVFATVTFYNNSTDDTIIVQYSIADFSTTNPTWSHLASTKPIPPQTAYADSSITLPDNHSKEFYGQRVTVIMPNKSSFTKNLTTPIPSADSCWSDNNGGVIFFAFNNQQDATCTSSTGKNTKLKKLN